MVFKEQCGGKSRHYQWYLVISAALPYIPFMHTVVKVKEYIVAAARAGMTEVERIVAVDLVAANPEAGEIIRGGGGVRKLRVAGRGKGKSGGYRVITYYWSAHRPVFLLTLLNKGKQANFTDAQVAALREAAKFIREGQGNG